MSDTAISVENLSKTYRLGEVGTGSLAHDINRWWHRMRGKEDPYAQVAEVNDRTRRGTSEYVRALSDISLEIQRGEIVGIIGRNGAGKSTILKILSRITAPSVGQVRIRGRVASLLEVGTGFHPELTGRENIYLNATILGMTRREVDKHFDEIVEFSGVERYIDTPIKRYSSGMQVRLAFAVAAHLESEILVVDEVLAVGDYKFQQKCMGKMRDLASGGGRTILFVSHNTSAIQTLCNRGVVLESGRLAFDGSQLEAIEYYAKGEEGTSVNLAERTDRIGNGSVRVTGVRVTDYEGRPLDAVASGARVRIHVDFEVRTPDPVSNVLAVVQLTNLWDEPVFQQHNRLYNTDFGELPRKGTFVCAFDKFPVPPGSYNLTTVLMPDGGTSFAYFDKLTRAYNLEVIPGSYYPSGVFPSSEFGRCLVDADWSMESRVGQALPV